MKLRKRLILSVPILLCIGIVGILWIITTSTIFAVIMALLGVLGTFLQWLFPLSASSSEVALISNATKQSPSAAKIEVEPLERQRFEEQKAQAEIQKKKARRKKWLIRVISSISFAVLALGLIAIAFLQSQSQISFIANDNNYLSRVTSIAWSPNGEFVASATLDGDIRIWNVVNGGTFFVFQPPSYNTYDSNTEGYNNLVWSPDGKYIAFGENINKISIVEVSNKNLIYINAGSSEAVNTVAWSPNGEYLTFGGDDANVYVAKFSSRKIINRYPNGAPITALAWSQNGKLIASAGKDGRIHVWSTLSEKGIFAPSNYGGVVSSLAWSPTSPTLFASASSDFSDSQVHIWDITKGDADNPIETYNKHSGGVNGLAWSPDGKEIASVGNDGTLRVWDEATKNDLSIYPFSSRSTNIVLTAVGWSLDGKSIAFGYEESSNYGYQFFNSTAEVIKFCRSGCLFQ